MQWNFAYVGINLNGYEISRIQLTCLLYNQLDFAHGFASADVDCNKRCGSFHTNFHSNFHPLFYSLRGGISKIHHLRYL